MGEQFETLEYLNEKIDELRYILDSSLKDINYNEHSQDVEVLKLSQILDDYIVKYMKFKIQ